MRSFQMSKLHCPIHKMKVKRTHYKVCLGVSSILILVFHFHWPEYESHMAVAVNLLFVVDPTA